MLTEFAAARLADDLFETIKHGDDGHREWLRAALHQWFAQKLADDALSSAKPAEGESSRADPLPPTKGIPQ
jgi:hypothetical protein